MDVRSRERLGLKLQDVWGYFDTILGGDAFAEGPKTTKLRGKLRLYKQGHEYLLQAADMLPPGDPAHKEALDLLFYDELDDERALNQEAKDGRAIAMGIGKRYGIDVRTSYLIDEGAVKAARLERRSRRASRRRR